MSEARSRCLNRGLGIAVLCALVVTGCAVGPDYHRPTVVVPPKWKAVAPWKEGELLRVVVLERAKPPNNWLKRANAVALNLQLATESVRLMAVFLQLWQYCRMEL